MTRKKKTDTPIDPPAPPERLAAVVSLADHRKKLDAAEGKTTLEVGVMEIPTADGNYTFLETEGLSQLIGAFGDPEGGATDDGKVLFLYGQVETPQRNIGLSMSPKEARALAIALIECAFTLESDAPPMDDEQ